MNKAAIDIGSNSLLLTIIDVNGHTIVDEARVVQLGKGLGDRGQFLPDRMKAAETVFQEFVAIAKAHGIAPYAIQAVATSAARRAMNARTWFTRVSKKYGVRVRIISGEEEARLTWAGASGGRSLQVGPTLVIDLGGGSTELVLGQGKDIHLRTSLEVGSVRLTEAFMKEDPYSTHDLSVMKNYLDTVIAEIKFDPKPETIIGVAGTVTTLASIQMGLKEFDSRAIHGAVLSRSDLSQFEKQFINTSKQDRLALVPTSPKRADFLLAGVAILDRILCAAQSTELISSNGGIRYGVLSP